MRTHRIRPLPPRFRSGSDKEKGGAERFERGGIRADGDGSTADRVVEGIGSAIDHDGQSGSRSPTDPMFFESGNAAPRPNARESRATSTGAVAGTPSAGVGATNGTGGVRGGADAVAATHAEGTRGPGSASPAQADDVATGLARIATALKAVVSRLLDVVKALGEMLGGGSGGGASDGTGSVGATDSSGRTGTADGAGATGSGGGLSSAYPVPAGDEGFTLPPGIPAADASILSRAGVPGGIPAVDDVVETVGSGSSGAQVQAAIDRAASAGGGVVSLASGDYDLPQTLDMRSGVVLRGEQGTRLVGQMTSGDDGSVVNFDKGVSGAGLEGVTVTHGRAGDPAPKDFENRASDLMVSGVTMRGDGNWLRGAHIHNNGTDPVEIHGENNTVSSSVIDGSVNKGGGGNGYFSVNADNNLIVNNEIHNIRHFSIQGGAGHNVVSGNNLTVDINFHNGDDGRNAILDNSIDVSGGHNWDAIATGGAEYGHKPPGESNFLFGNRGAEGFDPERLMSFSGYKASNKYAL